jgi:hypothetical protein
LAISLKYTPESNSEIYDYTKLMNLSDNEINNLYNSNYQKVVILDTYGLDGARLMNGTGFFIEME